MDIGTAKPSPQELKKTVHWLVDFIEPSQHYSAYQFSSDALQIIRQLAKQNRRVFICGGTGFYFNSLKNGITPEVPPDLFFRALYREKVLKNGRDAIYQELLQHDPETAQKLHPHDSQRIIRALQVYYQSGIPLSQHNNMKNPPKDIKFLVFILSLHRSTLYKRINQRVDKMFQKGLWEEFNSLRRKGYTDNDPGMHCLGYKELFQVENKSIDLDNSIEEIKLNSRHYAKRQITWFINKTDGIWTDVSEKSAYLKIKSKILQYI
jgi:tRNA dimethylallyltransferase